MNHLALTVVLSNGKSPRWNSKLKSVVSKHGLQHQEIHTAYKAAAAISKLRQVTCVIVKHVIEHHDSVWCDGKKL